MPEHSHPTFLGPNCKIAMQEEKHKLYSIVAKHNYFKELFYWYLSNELILLVITTTALPYYHFAKMIVLLLSLLLSLVSQ